MTPLRQRMTEDMQVRNLALNTQTSYVQQVSLFARYFNRSPELLGPEDIRTSRTADYKGRCGGCLPKGAPMFRHPQTHHSSFHAQGVGIMHHLSEFVHSKDNWP